MTFLALTLALLLEQWRPLRSGNPLYAGFGHYVNRLAESLNAGQYRDGATAWALAVLPAALLAFVVYLLSRQLNWLAVLAWNVAVLYIALGFRQFSHFYTDVAAALRGGELAHARAVIARWRGGSAGGLTEGEVARVAIELGLQRSHRHVFGVIVWFVLLGAAGAIIYRLAALLHDRWGSERDGDGAVFGRFAARAFVVMDWLPLRMTAFSFAVAGDFMGAIECWRAQAATWRDRTQGLLLAAAAGALGVKLGGVLHEDSGIEYRPQLGDGEDADVNSMEAAAGLIWRALVLWLFLVLLVTLARAV
jgi:cobalamin biosynthesis protein CobD/CbiB